MDLIQIRRIEQLIKDSSFHSWCLDEEVAREYSLQQWADLYDLSRQEVQVAQKIVIELGYYQSSMAPDKKQKAWNNLAKRIEKKDRDLVELPSKKRSWGWIYTAAAAFILLLVSFLTIEFASLNSEDAASENQKIPPKIVVSTDYGEQKVIRLDSGTKITLNSNSTLTYRKGWIFNDEVKVQLKGEAYFDVAKRTNNFEWPFKVVTDDGDISVLGTRFVVTDWDETSVVLEEGKVSINKPVLGNSDKKAVLEPNQIAKFESGTKDIDIYPVNPRLYTSWTKGFFAFDQTPLIKIANRIQRTFGIEVVITDPSLLTRKVSGSVEAKNAEVVITGIAKTLQISADFSGDKVFLRDSVFSPSLINKSTNLN